MYKEVKTRIKLPYLHVPRMRGERFSKGRATLLTRARAGEKNEKEQVEVTVVLSVFEAKIVFLIFFVTVNRLYSSGFEKRQPPPLIGICVL